MWGGERRETGADVAEMKRTGAPNVGPPQTLLVLCDRNKDREGRSKMHWGEETI